jgi:hypothetical protein
MHLDPARDNAGVELAPVRRMVNLFGSVSRILA